MTRRVVIAGGGLAGWTAARALRRHGFDDEIVLIGRERHPAYSRPLLSKQFLLNPDKQPANLYLPAAEGLAVETQPGRATTGLDLGRREVLLDDGQRVRFDGLVIATGAAPRQLPMAEIDGVHVLRTLEDAQVLREEMASQPRVVVVGAGFIGSEVAAAARQRCLDVTLVDAAALPLEQALGRIAAAAVRDLHASHGVRLRLGTTVQRLVGSGRVEAVTLATGETLPADLVVVGVGVAPATGWLHGSGLSTVGGVLCDASCRALDTGGVVAAGDVARWYNPLFRRYMRVEHWSNASAQAEAAAAALLAPDVAQPYMHVPFFWSEQYGVRLQFIGNRSDGQDGTVIQGSVSTHSCVIAYEDDGLLTGALAVNQPRECRRLRDLIQCRAPFDAVFSESVGREHTGR